MKYRLSFEDANNLPFDILVDAFEIESAESCCENCTNYRECRAKDQFLKDNPADAVERCRFFEVV